MKVRSLFTICLSILLTVNPGIAQTSKNSDVNAFWAQFKAAVIRKDKNAVANMTKFPLSMPYGQKSVRSKPSFCAATGRFLTAKPMRRNVLKKPSW